MGGGTPLIVNVVSNESIDDCFDLDKTWQEIYDAFPNVYIKGTEDDTFMCVPIRTIFFNHADGYVIETGDMRFFALTSTDYPSTCTNK